MFLSIPLSCFYVCAVLAFLSAAFCFKKAEKKQNAMVWVPVVLIGFLCLNALVAGVISLVHIPINLLSMGIMNLLAAVLMWVWIIKKKQFQSYYLNWFDVFAVLAIFSVVMTCAFQLFGSNLWINYETSDPAIHFREAMKVLNTQKIGGMYFSSLNNGLLLSILAPFFTLLKYYKIFILADICMYLLSSWMFYSLIRKFCKTIFLKFCGLAVTLIYILGYPLNNMIFGFVYLGIGVMIIAYLIFLCDSYIENGVSRIFFILSMMLGCMGLIVCYSLFVPVVYIGVALAVAFPYVQRKQLLPNLKKVIGIEFAIFLLPTLIGIYYSFFGVFSSEVSAGSAIAAEGYIYRDLFMDFVPFLPFALYGLLTRLQKKKFTAGVLLLFLFSVFTFGLFLLGMKGKVSSYYYFKTYYVIWMLVFYFLMVGIAKLAKKSKTALLSYALVWLLVGAVSFTKLDEKVSKRNILFEPAPRSSMLFGLYEFNRNKLQKESTVTGERFQLYEFVEEHCPSENPIPLADDHEGLYWYEGITNQLMESFYTWNTDAAAYQEKLQSVDYVIVMKDSQAYQANRNYLDSLHRVYDNAAGFVAQVHA